VSRIVDGDTIVVDVAGVSRRVRYIGMDTPETVDPRLPIQWMGPEASKANKRLVRGKVVVLERDISDTDQYGRLLRDVWLETPTGWLLVNLELVRLGYAQVATYPPDVKYVDELLAAQDQARDLGIGLWGDEPAPTVTPKPAPQPTPRATNRPRVTPRPPSGNCDASYPDFCIPPPPPDLDCGDIGYTDFTVYEPDPHRFDGDNDGVGCES
jgi:micrococcal nuclease